MRKKLPQRRATCTRYAMNVVWMVMHSGGASSFVVVLLLVGGRGGGGGGEGWYQAGQEGV